VTVVRSIVIRSGDIYVRSRHTPLEKRKHLRAQSKPSDRRKEGKMLGGLSTDTIIVVGLMVAVVLFIIWLRRQ
jgi:hypothetical protein